MASVASILSRVETTVRPIVVWTHRGVSMPEAKKMAFQHGLTITKIVALPWNGIVGLVIENDRLTKQFYIVP